MQALGPSSKAGDAVRVILLEQLAALRRNESGTIRNLAPEFLHDYRVAVRRSRVAVGELKAALAPEAVRRFRPDLSWLGKITGPARDLDVLALQLPERVAAQPDAARPDLETITRRLEAERLCEHRELSSTLGGARYRDLMAAWSGYLEGDRTRIGPPAAERPIEPLATLRIERALRRVLEKGGAITGESPLSDLHRVRLACKKLRYLLEFFRALFAVEDQIRALKRLQDNLGAMNDCRFERRLLTRLERDPQLDGASRRAASKVIRPLVTELDTGVEIERERFAERFAEFRATV